MPYAKIDMAASQCLLSKKAFYLLLFILLTHNIMRCRLFSLLSTDSSIFNSEHGHRALDERKHANSRPQSMSFLFKYNYNLPIEGNK